MTEQSIGFGREENLEFRTTGWVVSEGPVTPPAAGIPEGYKAGTTAELYCSKPEKALGTPSRNCEVPVMATVAAQPWGEPYDAETGLTRGTIFPALDLPFIGRGACRYE